MIWQHGLEGWRRIGSIEERREGAKPSSSEVASGGKLREIREAERSFCPRGGGVTRSLTQTPRGFDAPVLRTGYASSPLPQPRGYPFAGVNRQAFRQRREGVDIEIAIRSASNRDPHHYKMWPQSLFRRLNLLMLRCYGRIYEYQRFHQT